MKLAEQVELIRQVFGYVDQDYSLRVRRHGFRIVYVPAAKVWHKVGASAKKVHMTYADPASYYHFIKQNFPFYFRGVISSPAVG